jgi:arylsulfatase A-like enzyme
MDGRLLDPTSPYYNKVLLRGIKDGLVARGATFARHFTASPQCVPSRTSMMTGRYVHEMDTTNNGQGLARSTKTGKLDSSCVAAWNATSCTAFAALQNQTYTMLDLLAGAGYDLQLFARFDVGAGVLDDYPTHKPTGDGFHGGPDLGILARGASIPGATKEEPFGATDDNATNPYAGDVAVGEAVVKFLTNHDPTEEQPFLLWMGLIAPHPPYTTSAAYLKHVNMSAADAPMDVCQPDRATMHPYDIQMSTLKNCFQRDYSSAELLEMRTTYWAAVGEAMEIVNSVIAAASASGHLNNTVIIYTSDHGEMSMEHRMDYKNNLREPSLRVPLIIAPYGVPPSRASHPRRS